MEQSREKNLARDDRAWNTVGWYTLAAEAKGAIPIPAMSAAIVVNNGVMITHISDIYDENVTWDSVIQSLGFAGAVNVWGRMVFTEFAKAISWGTGSPWGAVALSCIGIATAGLQTLIIGAIAIKIARNGGKPLTAKEVASVTSMAKKDYKSFVAGMRGKNPPDPSLA
ncbi:MULTISPECIES: hypothetical protein [Aeromonas]|uniref:hypothetical protein n=1 Tax=Aeromonas TaxID=642 RepID=UPI001BFC2C30|nr:hypothetical protein [Aeromonas dhakensis]HDT5887714.1 hypothetical protein [Aeromonas dhakensis]HEB4979183.1 hypothetical protein [Aeromonas dhakensis]